MGYQPDRPLEMEVRREGPAAVILIHGSAGIQDAEQIGSALQDLTAKQSTPIVLDLSDLDFICSVGLGAIISGHLRTRRRPPRRTSRLNHHLRAPADASL